MHPTNQLMVNPHPRKEAVMNFCCLKNLRRSSLSVAVVATLCGSTAIPALAAVPASGLVTLSHPLCSSRGDAITGALPMSQPIQIVVGLKMRDRDGLDAFIKANAKTQAAGSAPRLMSHDDFLAQHAPTAVQAQTVANYLTRMGFTNVVIAPNRLLVSANGTAATAANAFLTSFSQVRTQDGRIAFANNTDAHIPAALQGTIEAVVGLQTVHVPRTSARLSGKDPHHAAGAMVPTSGTHYVYEYQYPTIYGTAGSRGARATDIGLLTSGDLTSTIADLNNPTSASANCFYSNTGSSGAGGGVCRTIPTMVVDVGTGPWTGVDNDVEWHLDSQTVAGVTGQYNNTVANQLNRIVFYNVTSLSNADVILGINQAVSDNLVHVFNGSITECEKTAAPTSNGGDGSASLADSAFAAGVAQGQTFVFPTGDFGADECQNGGVQPSWPANSPYVIAVAGTSLTDTGGGTGVQINSSWVNETVWAGTGGSQSTYEPKPTWQTAWTGANRGVADVAFNASDSSPTMIYLDDGAHTSPATTASPAPTSRHPCFRASGRACSPRAATASGSQGQCSIGCRQPISTT